MQKEFHRVVSRQLSSFEKSPVIELVPHGMRLVNLLLLHACEQNREWNRNYLRLAMVKRLTEVDMSILSRSCLVRASIIAVALGFGATGVMATPPAAKPVQQEASSDVLLIKHKKGHYKKHRYYDKKRHWRYEKRYGKRYRHHRHGYDHYYGGWYYPRPYWRNEPGIYLRFDL